MVLRLITLLTVVVLALPAAPPNIVFILADDMGYGDVRALNPGVEDPNAEPRSARGAGHHVY